MSGGGIRSAIFNLGVLQALHQYGIFSKIDYISTVSGGGYVGTTLSVLMREAGTTFPFSPHGQVIQWLRNRSQYLSPAGLWLRTGSIVLFGAAVNLLTLSPIILMASFVIALYGRFRLTDLLTLPQPTFDPLWLLAGLVLAQAAMSLLEGTMVMAVWPEILRDERVDRARAPIPPAVQRRWKRRLSAARIVASLTGLLSFVPIVSDTFTRLVDFMSSTLDDFLRKDWRALRRKSLQSRLAFRRSLEWLVTAIAIFGFLELQPEIIRFVRSGPIVGRDFFSIELWTAVITFAGAVASMISLNGGKWLGVTMARIAPAAAAAITAIGFYLFCMLIAQRLLFDAPRELWTWDGLKYAFTSFSGDVEALMLAALLVIVIAAVYVVVPWVFFDLNERSVHGFYRDSLGESFVVGNAPTGLETEGDLKLSDFSQPGSAAPFQLFNATLNLQTDPALQNTGRNGDFFLFTKDYVGSERTKYAPTELLETSYGKFTAASAMATSGAAASPHMGIFTQRPLVFVMSLLNIRLGVWLPNPMYLTGKSWYPNPFWLFREMRRNLDAQGRGIYVSDGGHLENLGVYQLLKRRCRFIIVVDATTDPDLEFQSLADAKRYARVDLSVEIDIDVSPLKLGADGRSRAHWVAGVIRYPATGSEPAATGVIYVIKASLTGDEDVEIQAYKAGASSFPHEPLSDQFFDEGQFEAYGLLGFHAATSMLQANPFSASAVSATVATP